MFVIAENLPGIRCVEMGSEIKQLKHEIGTLKRENTKLREENSKLQQSLDELRTNRPRRATLRSLKLPSGQSHASPATAGEDDSELQRALIEQLIEMRQQLSTVQDRLTVAEQVTAATQRRELAQEGVCETDSDYEELEFDTTEEHVYARLKSSTQKGSIICIYVVFSICSKDSLFTVCIYYIFSYSLHIANTHTSTVNTRCL